MSILLLAVGVILGMTILCGAVPKDMAPLGDPAILALRPAAAKLPPTDTAILWNMISIAILDSGRADHTERLCRYLRSDNAWDDYGDPHFAYDQARQTLTVYGARTHTVDGRIVQTKPKNGYNPMVPFGLDLAPDFTHHRQMVVTFLGIEPDAVTDIGWTIREQKALYSWAWGEITFGGNEPIVDKLVLVGAPQTENLKVVSVDGAPEAEHWVDTGRDIYGWRMKDLPPRNTSEAGSKPSQVLPRICYSTCPDWKTLTQSVHSRFTEALDQQGNLAAELAAFQTLPDDRQKIDSIITFLKDRITRVSWDELGMLIDFRSAEKTFSSGYGSPADLAVLTTAALKILGFKPQAFLASEYLMALPGFSGKESWMIQIHQNNLDALIDPVSGQIHWHSPQGTTLVGIYPPSEPQVVPPAPVAENLLKVDLGLTLQEDKTAAGWVIIDSRGAVAQYDKGSDSKAEDLVKSWTDKLTTKPEVSNARITALTPDHVAVQADLKFPANKDSLGDFLRLAVPWDAAGVDGFTPHGMVLNYPARDLPLFLDHAGTFEVNLQLVYPVSWKLITMPQTENLKAEGVVLQRSVSSDKGNLRVHESVTYDNVTVTSQNWEAWRKIVLAAGKANSRTVLLKAE
jgi:hypothetical protein